MDGNSFYTTKYDVFGDVAKAIERSTPDNLTRWIVIQSKDFTRKSIRKISRHVRR